MPQIQRSAARLTSVGGLLAAAALLSGCIIVVGGRGGYRHAYDSDPYDDNPDYEYYENTEQYTEERTLNVSHEVNSPLVVETTNGAIEVVQGDTDRVRVEAKVSSRWEDQLDEINVVANRRADGVLHIKPEWDGRKRDGDIVSFKVFIPDVSKATLTSLNGAITFSGLDCPVIASTQNGFIELLDVSGPVTATSQNGSITVRQTSDAGGPVRVETQNGIVDVRLGGAFEGTMKAYAANGVISVTGLEGLGSDITMKSISGRRVTFTIGDAAQPESWARTVNGEVKISAVE